MEKNLEAEDDLKENYTENKKKSKKNKKKKRNKKNSSSESSENENEEKVNEFNKNVFGKSSSIIKDRYQLTQFS